MPGRMRKRGIVELNLQMLSTTAFEDRQIIFDGWVVWHCDTNYAKDCCRYWVEHADFEEVEDGAEPPEYNVVLELDEEGTKRTWFRDGKPWVLPE